jgi:ABC-2 type transport system permease protein
MRAGLGAAAAIVERDWRMWSSYRMRVVSTTIAAVVGVTLFYYVSRLVTGGSQFTTPDEYYGFVVVGMVILQVLTSSLTAPVAALRAELVAGTFERIVVSPFGPVAAIVSLNLWPLALGLASGTLTLTLAAAIFGLGITWSTAPLAIPVALLGALAFAPFGVLLASAVMLFKQSNVGAAYIVTALSLVAGIYFPVSLLPGWLQWLSDVQPFTPAVDLLRHLLVGTPMPGSAGVALLTLVGFAVVMLPLAVVVLHVAIARSRRNGTICEY